ncbi:SpaH/EbpB family LPXTG-anchored major pilin [Leucobacter chinensis]|uniref:SpaH/EbpB family LPXTG-anchored major pilin n=1 Tax=Leucobacter chinensis TaxID=2851010 RepID=UPI001C232EF1|nr:SpaH/EbpB family LPXTG-anchored major pilin [Leucobacter chinensis]
MAGMGVGRGLRRGLAVTAVAAVGAAGLFAGASAAQAVEIKPDLQGSLTVHKYENPGQGEMHPDGSGTKPSSNPIDGVVFEYCPIESVDLFDGTNEGWDALTVLGKNADALKGARSGQTLGSYSLGECHELPATVDGVASSGAIDLGAYLVRETKVPEKVTKKSEPFIVTIPTPATGEKGDGASWVYDVNVYPKNDVGDKPSKTIQNQPENGFVVGADVDYRVSQVLPAVTDDQYTKLVVTDTLDARLKGEGIPVVQVNGVTVTTGYTAAWTVDGEGRSVLTVSFDEAGLAGLKTGDTVTVDFVAVVESLGDGEIANQAFVNVNDLDLDGDGKPGTPTDEVWTRWGGLKLQKIDAGKAGKGLEGAEFKLLISEVASGCVADKSLPAVTGADGKELKLVSGADGTITVPGLWIGDDELQGGTMTNGLKERCYVLVETKAPAGFVLPDADGARTEVVVKPGAVTEFSAKVKNVQQEVPELPMTGGAGQVLLVVGGLALVVVAAGSVMITRRKNTAA